MLEATAAILHQGEKAMRIEPVQIENPRAGELRVRIVATGICHTDMVMRDGGVPTPQPVVLGHEGAGIVESIGEGVSGFKPGDRVVMSFNHCEACPSCLDHEPAYCHEFFPRNFFATRGDGSTAITARGEKIHSHVFGQSSFATYAICHAHNAVRVPDDVPLELMGPMGCGFQTGAGAVLRALMVEPGKSLAVFGVGAVGMSAVMAAKIAEAGTVIAVDINDDRLELSRSLGATHAVHGVRQDMVETIRAICPDGLDYIIDTTARVPLIESGIGLLAPRGVCGLVGAFTPGDQIQFDAVHLMSGGRQIRGIVEGDSNPVEFIPELIDYYRNGQFPVERLVRFFDFADINEAIEAGESGRVIKPIIRMPQ